MVICVLISCMTLGHVNVLGVYGQQEYNEEGDDPQVETSVKDPLLTNPDFTIKEIAKGLNRPTTMAFLGQDDILVLEKEKGTIRRILDGKLLNEPVLDVNVANGSERGMIGIAASTSEVGNDNDKDVSSPKTYVYVYFTEAEEEGSDKCIASRRCDDVPLDPLGNRLYKYEWIDGRLINPLLLFDLPSTPGPEHNGGVISIGPDGNIYIGIGDLLRGPSQNPPREGKTVDGRSGILRITPNGQPVGKGLLGDTHPLNFYYAYGIRNTFGMDFDPVTGNLWDTENGGGVNDEINLVKPRFNSGWEVIQGMIKDPQDTNLDEADISELEDFKGRGSYSDPEFVWHEVVGPTALTFLDSDALGQENRNDMFVGDYHRGNIYRFELNSHRIGLILNGPLEDKVSNDDWHGNDGDLEEVIFGRNFGGISDIDVGPDGYLYIVSIGLGKVFRIEPIR
jgi:aldose sugar dehydrogenase